jgi:hypothetical protein
MAFALIAQIDFKDAKNKSSFTRIRLPTGLTIAQYTSFVQDAAQAATDISGCIVTGASIGINFTFTGLGAAAAAAADVASKGFFKVRSAVAGFFAKMSIPTFDEDTLVVAGTDQIDTADTAVAAYITLVETGDGTVAPCDKYGNDLVDVEISVEQFMRHNG